MFSIFVEVLTVFIHCSPKLGEQFCDYCILNHLLLLFSHSVLSNSLWPHGLQCTRLPFTISQSFWLFIRSVTFLYFTKWLSEEALQIAKERRDTESKGERERHIQLNTDFQRTSQRDKKAFFNEQCIILEENNRRGKTRDIFRKIGDTKGTFCPKMGTIKDKQ